MKTSNSKIENERYWENRSFHDKRRDWMQSSGNWIEDYWGSKSHPHRQLILDEIGHLEPFESVLEIGSNCGPNLSLIREKFNYLKDYNLTGVDINKDAIEKARKMMPAVECYLGDFMKDYQWAVKEHDIVISDAVLMYVPPDEIEDVIRNISKIARKAIVLVEWFDEDKLGVIKDFHWARNYEALLTDKGFKVHKIKLTKEHWPSDNWVRNGYMFVGVKNGKKIKPVFCESFTGKCRYEGD